MATALKVPVREVTVYDVDGKAITVEPVDAREYLASGAYFSAPPAPPAADPSPAVAAAEAPAPAPAEPPPEAEHVKRPVGRPRKHQSE